ncbi:hypothetical protein acdb102_19700 [Acidothermaceae bacterium B102]|nr:hypothetical protein acdb102_19700 [Acidothermaceae bacterium B102]
MQQPSRWRKGTTTFGPFGRVSWTICVVVLPAFVGMFGGIGGIVFVGIWCGVIAPMALRDLWKADTLYVPGQRSAPPPNPVSYDGTRIPSLSEYVASQPKPPTTEPAAPPLS